MADRLTPFSQTPHPTVSRRGFLLGSLGALGAVGALGLAACSPGESIGENAVAVGGTFQFHSPGGQTEIHYAPEERQPLQELSGDSLMAEGTTISVADFPGQIVVLNSWGQWCAPCRTEVDDLETTQEAMQAEGLGTVLGINVRDYSRQIAQDFVNDNGVTYPSIYDPPFRSAAALGGVPTSVVPTTIVLDRQHRPAAVFLRQITSDELLATVRSVGAEA